MLQERLNNREQAESERAAAEEDMDVSREELHAAGVDERLLIRDGLALLGMVTRLAAEEL